MKIIKGLLIIAAATTLQFVLMYFLLASDDKGESPGNVAMEQPPGPPPVTKTNVPPINPIEEDKAGVGKEPADEVKTAVQEKDQETKMESTVKKPMVEETATTPAVTKITPTEKEEMLDIDSNNLDIKKVIEYYARQVDKNFIIPQALNAKVTIISGRKIPKSRAFEVLEAILDAHDYSMFEDENFVRIEKHGSQQHKDKPTNVLIIEGDDVSLEQRDKLVTAIVVLQYINATDIMQVLNSVKPTHAIITNFQRINALFIRDTERHLEYLLTIIKKLDQPGKAGKVTIVEIKYSASSTIVDLVTKVMSAQDIDTTVGAPVPAGRGVRTGTAALPDISIIEDSRTNSIIIVGTESETEIVLNLIAKLDTPQQETDISIHTYQCNNQKAPELAKILGDFVDKRPKVTTPQGATPIPGVTQMEFYFIADETTNTIIIWAPPKEWPAYLELLKQLDQPQRQALIEVWIVEVSSNDSMTLGVEIMPSDVPPNERTGPLQNEIYPVSRPTSTLSGLFGGTTSTSDNGNDGTGSATGFGATIGARALTATEISINGRKIRIPNFDVFMRAVKDKSSVRVLASPKLVTLNNEAASVAITDTISIRNSEVTNTESTGAVSTATYTRTPVGITFGITPQINSDDFIIMDLDLSVENIVGDLTVDPTVSTRKTKCIVRCENKQTIIISGLRRSDKNKSKTGIPILMDIPLIGRLFSSKTESSIDINLLIFITPHIISESSDMLAITDYVKNQRLSEEEKRFIITGRKTKKKSEDKAKAKVVWNR